MSKELNEFGDEIFEDPDGLTPDEIAKLGDEPEDPELPIDQAPADESEDASDE